MRQGWPIHLYHRTSSNRLQSQKRHALPGIAFCVASFTEANQRPTQFVVCVLLPAQNSLYPQRRPYLRTGGRTCHRSHVKLILQNLPVQRGHRVVEPASCDGWKGGGHVPRVGASQNWYRMRVGGERSGTTLTRRRVFSCVWW